MRAIPTIVWSMVWSVVHTALAAGAAVLAVLRVELGYVAAQAIALTARRDVPDDVLLLPMTETALGGLDLSGPASRSRSSASSDRRILSKLQQLIDSRGQFEIGESSNERLVRAPLRPCIRLSWRSAFTARDIRPPRTTSPPHVGKQWLPTGSERTERTE
jgi:hypothetical protein